MIMLYCVVGIGHIYFPSVLLLDHWWVPTFLYDKNGDVNNLVGPLVVQMVKNLPAMQETQVWFLGWEDPLEKRMATHSSILV